MPIGSEILKQFYISYKTVSDLRGSKRLKTEMREVSTVSKRTGRDFKEMGKVVRRASTAFVAVTAAIGGTTFALAALAEKGDRFRQQMIGLVGLAPQTAAAFSRAATTIAATYGRTLEEVGAAFYSTTSAGYRGRQAEEIVVGAARGAAAGLGTVDEVTKLLTLSLSVFKDDGLKAADALDKLAAGARQANFDGNALGAVLPQIGVFAKGLGVDFGEVTGLVAAMSKQMESATVASTALQSLLRSLAAPTSIGLKALKDLGIELQVLRDVIERDGLLAGVELLDTAIENAVGLGAEYDITLRAIVERIESQTAFKVLAGDLETANKIVNESTGSVDTLGEALDPVLLSTDALRSNFKLLGSELGENFIPWIDAAARKLGDLAIWMNENEGFADRLIGAAFLSGQGGIIGSGRGQIGKEGAVDSFTQTRLKFKQGQLDELAEENKRQEEARKRFEEEDRLRREAEAERKRLRQASIARGQGWNIPAPPTSEMYGQGMAAVGRYLQGRGDMRSIRATLPMPPAAYGSTRAGMMDTGDQVVLTLEQMAEAGRRATDGLLGFGDHLANFFQNVGLGGVGRGLSTAISGIDSIRSGIGAFRGARQGLQNAGGLGGLLASQGPMIAIAGVTTAIFGFLKIRAKRREKREERRRQEQQRYHLETMRALNPYSHMRGQSLGNIGRYWSGGGFDDVFLGGGSTVPSEGPGLARMGGGQTMVQAPVSIMVNAGPGMDEQMIAHQVQQKLTAVFRQTAADFG